MLMLRELGKKHKTQDNMGRVCIFLTFVVSCSCCCSFYLIFPCFLVNNPTPSIMYDRLLGWMSRWNASCGFSFPYYVIKMNYYSAVSTYTIQATNLQSRYPWHYELYLMNIWNQGDEPWILNCNLAIMPHWCTLDDVFFSNIESKIFIWVNYNLPIFDLTEI